MEAIRSLVRSPWGISGDRGREWVRTPRRWIFERSAWSNNGGVRPEQRWWHNPIWSRDGEFRGYAGWRNYTDVFQTDENLARI